MKWKAMTLLRDYATWMRQLARGGGQMFAARSPVGRSAKIFLFGVGVALPLGSLIWLLLFWHGNGVARRGRLAVAAADGGSLARTDALAE